MTAFARHSTGSWTAFGRTSMRASPASTAAFTTLAAHYDTLAHRRPILHQPVRGIPRRRHAPRFHPRRTGRAPHTSCDRLFEITETVAVSNFTSAVALVTELRRMGCRSALDDFGSGLSSFAYLRNLPVDFLKIDGQFVRGITHHTIDRATGEAVNRIGHDMGIRTIGEYVESGAIRDSLRDLGVDFAQGFAVS